MMLHMWTVTGYLMRMKASLEKFGKAGLRGPKRFGMAGRLILTISCHIANVTAFENYCHYADGA